jgi:hypothetical protein
MSPIPGGDELIPTERDAVALVERVLGVRPRSVTRFPTGLAHYVYDISLSDERAVVARLTTVTRGSAFTSAVSWSGRLRPRGVPLPRLLAFADRPEDGSFPFMLLE